jgi:hypothetical protein
LRSAETRYIRHLFVDNFYLVALAHRRDQWHAEELEFSRSLGIQFPCRGTRPESLTHQ